MDRQTGVDGVQTSAGDGGDVHRGDDSVLERGVAMDRGSTAGGIALVRSCYRDHRRDQFCPVDLRRSLLR